jgi:hypothetical protein
MRDRLNRSKLIRWGQQVDLTLGRSTPRRQDESTSRSAAPARNQQTGCSGRGSKSTLVTSRSIRPTNVSPPAALGMGCFLVRPVQSRAQPD